MKKQYLIAIFAIIVLIVGWLVYGAVNDRDTETAVNQSEETAAPIVEETADSNEEATEVEAEPLIPAETEETEAETVPATAVNHTVPFTTQAPTGQWEDQRQQDGCEEASALMAIRWVQGGTRLSTTEARQEIIAMSDFEQSTYGEYRDVSLEDLRDWIFIDYFKHSNVEVKKNITVQDIIAALHDGNIVIAPMNGKALNNPYFSGDGPERHMLVITGHDPASKQFITNDPGTKRGEGYRYSEDTIYNAILDYPTGYHEPADPNKKSILIVRK